MPCDFIDMKFKNGKANRGEKSQNSAYLWEELTREGQEGNFWSRGNCLHLDLGGGYTGVFGCENSLR